jgi:carboxymethylenebutenolidase
MTGAVTQLEIDQRVFDLYDEYCHGRVDRRQFLLMAGAVAGGLAMAQALLPRYAEAQTISTAPPPKPPACRRSRPRS